MGAADSHIEVFNNGEYGNILERIETGISMVLIYWIYWFTENKCWFTEYWFADLLEATTKPQQKPQPSVMYSTVFL